MVGEVLLSFLDMRGTALAVAGGLFPLVGAAWLFTRLPWNRRRLPTVPGEFAKILRGAALVFVGLTLFLRGVGAGFEPVGRTLGASLAGLWGGLGLVPFGFFLGLALCLAEPAVSVLGDQVEKATSGSIPKRLLVGALCAGVAMAGALGFARLLWGVPILWIVAPGYALAIAASRFCTSEFVPIAYDSSTVVTGPMVAGFLLAVALGAADVLEHANPLIDGFGLVAATAMLPVIVVMLLGCLHAAQRRKYERNKRI